MQEINTTESACNDGIDGLPSTLNLNLCVTSDVGEDIAFTQLNKGQLTVVTVGKEIYNAVMSASGVWS